MLLPSISKALLLQTLGWCCSEKKYLNPTSKSTVVTVKLARGRPKDREVEQSQQTAPQNEAIVQPSLPADNHAPPKRGPGRPKKAGPGLSVNNQAPPNPLKRGPGRPRKRPLTPPPCQEIVQPPSKLTRKNKK